MKAIQIFFLVFSFFASKKMKKNIVYSLNAFCEFLGVEISRCVNIFYSPKAGEYTEKQMCDASKAHEKMYNLKIFISKIKSYYE